MSEYTLERLVPETIICGGVYVPVGKVVAHPPGHEVKTIRKDLTAVVVHTERGTRSFGTSKAWIGSDLRMHMLVPERDEVRRNWEQPS